MELLIKNGQLILEDQIITADLRISKGKIIQIEPDLSRMENEIQIDAKSAYVIPAGIDPHVHLKLITPAGFSADDFESGSKAAIAGGTTTFIDFVTPEKGEKLTDALQKRLEEVKNCACDYAFHMSIVEWRDSIPQEMEACVQSFGISSFKTYLAYRKSIGIDFETLEKVMQTAKKLGVVVTIHAELGNTIDELREDSIQKGHIGLENHSLTRPDYTEYEAIEKVIGLVEKTQCTTYIVHVSTSKSLDLIAEAKNKNLPIFAETCPQYFSFNNEVYKGLEEEALAYLMSPPIRSESNRLGICKHLEKGTITALGTDHCPFKLEQKKGKIFTEIPNGAQGIQHRLSVLYSQFVINKRISLIDFAKLTASNPATFFRINNKGKIAIGYDADLIIWKEEKKPIAQIHEYSKGDLNIYKTLTSFGRADYVIKNGIILYDQEKLADYLPNGNYLFRN
ncbi:MAG: dihydropyrimidinase [Bacteroidales bacterium]|nr:dihydropyrimidinase [Bacteroidales bacterium]